MEFLQLKDISERFMEVINPSTPEKLLTIGRVLDLRAGSRVIDFGCGFGALLALWGEHFGIEGVGIDLREYACQRARQTLQARGLAERIAIVQGRGQDFAFEPGAYDVAACVGASFIWGGYQPTIEALRRAIRPDGRLVIGEPYWRTSSAPPTYAQRSQGIHTEHDLWRLTRAAGFDLLYIVRSGEDDWDRYESDNWRGLVAWLAENPDHPERQQVLDHLHETQEDYLQFGREFLGWALYVLVPAQT